MKEVYCSRERPTDVRNIYVPMTRGTETNEAFLVTTGEQTVLDVFIQSLTTDWIDQPAIARQAELNDTKPHRPGLLDGSQLRGMLRSSATNTTSAIARAEYDLKRLLRKIYAMPSRPARQRRRRSVNARRRFDRPRA